MSAFKQPSRYNYFINCFKENQDKIELECGEQSDEAYIKSITRKCQQCNVPVERTKYCNHMVCPYCKCEFCWICKEIWHPKQKTNDFDCPNRREEIKKLMDKQSHCSIDFSDPNDFTFYPQPMTIEKRLQITRYKKYLKQYKEEKDNYNQLELAIRSDDADKLSCKKKVIEKIFSTEFEPDKSKLISLIFTNNLLFAQLVFM